MSDGLNPIQNGCSADFDNVSLHTTHEVSASSNNRERSNSNNNNVGNSAGSSSSSQRSKDHTLNQLGTQNQQPTTSKQQNANKAGQGNMSGITANSGSDASDVSNVHFRADGQVLNSKKLRPKTSALTMSMCSNIEPDLEPTDTSSMNGISRMIHRHYSRVDYVRSEADLAREAYLIGNIKFNRWIFLPAAFCFQAICGTLYACE